MGRFVDLDERVTAQFYDEECEEWTMRTVTIEDVLDSVCDDYTVLPSAQPEPQWIPCKKGEPDEDTECWVTVKTTDTLYRGNFTKRYGERRDKGFITSGGFMWWNTALAWMPIYEPKPYKEEP